MSDSDDEFNQQTVHFDADAAEKPVFIFVAVAAVVWVLAGVLFGVVGVAMVAIALTALVLLTLVLMTKGSKL